jgi:hypothetical protein
VSGIEFWVFRATPGGGPGGSTPGRQVTMPEIAIGDRVRLEYDDQNDSFARHLPIEGRISRRCTASAGPDDWLLVDLDEPIDYEREVEPGSQLQRLIVPRVLIRSRWPDMPIGPGASPSVFLLLVERSQEASESGLVIDDFLHACWARCHVLPAG